MRPSFIEDRKLPSENKSQIKYQTTREFGNDFKRLLKKFRSLEKDLELAKIATIEPYHIGILIDGLLEKRDTNAIFPIQQFCTDEILICKLKKFACKALKGRGVRSGIRIIYAFHTQTLMVKFIEIYFKGESENEDKNRIKAYLTAL